MPSCLITATGPRPGHRVIEHDDGGDRQLDDVRERFGGECDGAVVGYGSSFVPAGLRGVSYWYGREHWGKGIATGALREFLGEVRDRLLFARVIVDHTPSRRVLENANGFYVKAKGAVLGRSGDEVDEGLYRPYLASSSVLDPDVAGTVVYHMVK